MMLVVLATILRLAWWSLQAQGVKGGPTRFDFDYNSFDASASATLHFLYTATIDSSNQSLKVLDRANPACVTNRCRGQVFHSTAIDLVDDSINRAYSFSTSFTFTITPSSSTSVGEGLVFMLIADPYTASGNGNHYFGLFPTTSSVTSPSLAVEFDTFENPELFDIDDNHIGVDVNKAQSTSAVSCSKADARLYSGFKIAAWIDYNDPHNNLQVRLVYWNSTVKKPTYPLLDMTLNLTSVVRSKMYAGFSAELESGHEQRNAIHSWEWHSKLDNPPKNYSPPQSPPQPPDEPEPFPWVLFPPAPPPNSTIPTNPRKKPVRLAIVIGVSVAGGFVLCLVVCGCGFCLGYYCSRRQAMAADMLLKKQRDAEIAAARSGKLKDLKSSKDAGSTSHQFERSLSDLEAATTSAPSRRRSPKSDGKESKRARRAKKRASEEANKTGMEVQMDAAGEFAFRRRRSQNLNSLGVKDNTDSPDVVNQTSLGPTSGKQLPTSSKKREDTDEGHGRSGILPGDYSLGFKKDVVASTNVFRQTPLNATSGTELATSSNKHEDNVMVLESQGSLDGDFTGEHEIIINRPAPASTAMAVRSWNPDSVTSRSMSVDMSLSSSPNSAREIIISWAPWSDWETLLKTGGDIFYGEDSSPSGNMTIFTNTLFYLPEEDPQENIFPPDLSYKDMERTFDFDEDFEESFLDEPDNQQEMEVPVRSAPARSEFTSLARRTTGSPPMSPEPTSSPPGTSSPRSRSSRHQIWQTKTGS